MNYLFENNLSFAKRKDQDYQANSSRGEFHFPVINGREVYYFCGNSLGLQPKKVKEYIAQDLKDWADWGVEGHFHAQTPWFSYHEFLRNPMARIVGAYPDEVVIMNTLTTNLHLLMVSFYRPDKKRNKIICEGGAFPSDQYALASQVRWHGFNPLDSIIELFPEPGETNLKTSQILEAIQENKDELALVMMGGVNYYTGQLFDMAVITAKAHEVGAMAGFDLAHAAGNVVLNLHEWNVDFAVWCSYKYLNAGPGGVAGAFVHRNHTSNQKLIRLAGWWGNDPELRFTMPKEFIPVKSADAWQLSNAPVLPMASLRASLDLFDTAGMEKLSEKSRWLTAYLQFIINEAATESKNNEMMTIITPKDEKQRGSQLSLQFKVKGKEVYDFLIANQVFGDWRSPDVIRFAPVPMYNSFEDIYHAGRILSEALQKVNK